mgnify:CR=1 FL=1
MYFMDVKAGHFELSIGFASLAKAGRQANFSNKYIKGWFLKKNLLNVHPEMCNFDNAFTKTIC